jgi:hypothetical protein
MVAAVAGRTTEGSCSPSPWRRPTASALELRRAQLAAAGAAEARQLALFATLHDDRRPPSERTAEGRYREPSLLDCAG